MEAWSVWRAWHEEPLLMARSFQGLVLRRKSGVLPLPSSWLFFESILKLGNLSHPTSQRNPGTFFGCKIMGQGLCGSQESLLLCLSFPSPCPFFPPLWGLIWSLWPGWEWESIGSVQMDARNRVCCGYFLHAKVIFHPVKNINGIPSPGQWWWEVSHVHLDFHTQSNWQHSDSASRKAKPSRPNRPLVFSVSSPFFFSLLFLQCLPSSSIITHFQEGWACTHQARRHHSREQFPWAHPLAQPSRGGVQPDSNPSGQTGGQLPRQSCWTDGGRQRATGSRERESHPDTSKRRGGKTGSPQAASPRSSCASPTLAATPVEQSKPAQVSQILSSF